MNDTRQIFNHFRATTKTKAKEAINNEKGKKKTKSENKAQTIICINHSHQNPHKLRHFTSFLSRRGSEREKEGYKYKESEPSSSGK